MSEKKRKRLSKKRKKKIYHVPMLVAMHVVGCRLGTKQYGCLENKDWKRLGGFFFSPG